MISSGENCGILFVATGDRYVSAALRAAEHIRRLIPDVALAIETDRPDSIPAHLFAHVQRIENGHARSKVDCLIRSPFQRTLYLDTDTRVLEDITDLFRLLDRFDIALTHAHARNRRQTRETWRIELPDSFPQLNGGVILYRKTDNVMRFLSDWSKFYREAGFQKDQVTLRELIWTSGLKLYVLPPEYNVRYLRYAYFWRPEEARPRILHLRRYHDSGNGFRRIASDRIKEARGDLGAALRALGGALKQALFLGGRETR